MQPLNAVSLELVCLYQLDNSELLDINSFLEYQYQTILLSDHGLSKSFLKTCLNTVKNNNAV